MELKMLYVSHLKTLIAERNGLIDRLANVNLQIGHLKMEAKIDHSIDIVKEYIALTKPE